MYYYDKRSRKNEIKICHFVDETTFLTQLWRKQIFNEKKKKEYLDKYYYEKIDNFLKQINSSVFEEIVAMGLKQKGYPVLCTIHLSKSGNIMLDTGERIEVKLNKNSVHRLLSGTNYVHAHDISGANELKPDDDKIMVKLNCIVRGKNETIIAHFNATQMNQVIIDSITLSGIHLPIRDKIPNLENILKVNKSLEDSIIKNPVFVNLYPGQKTVNKK